MPETVETIGIYAFGYNRKSLKSAKLPSKLKSIPDGIFYLCDKLETVNIPPTITRIGDSAFTWCSSLKSFPIPETVTYIGSYAFEFCASFDELVIPESVQAIGRNAFYGCLNLQSISLPGNLKAIEDYTFYQCTNSLQSLVLPNSIERIGNYAFGACNSLKNIKLHNNLKTVGSYAFSGCRSLTTLDLPYKVDSLSDNFIANSGVKDLVLHSVPKLSESPFTDSKIEDIHLHLTDSSYLGLPVAPVTPTTMPTYSRTTNSEWGTLVLPFDAEAESEQYELYEAKELIDETTLKLKRVYGQVMAGTPVFVHILPASKRGDKYELSITGTYSVKDLSDEQGYIISNDKFWNIQDVRGNKKVYCAPFHAYFSGSLTNEAHQFGLSHSDATTDIRVVEGSGRPTYYHLSGRTTDGAQRGVHLVRSADGMVKKVLK